MSYTPAQGIVIILFVPLILLGLFGLVITFILSDKTESYTDKKSLGKHIFLLQERTQLMGWTGDASNLEMKRSLQWPDGTIELVEDYKGEMYEQFYGNIIHEASLKSFRGRYYLRLDAGVWSRPRVGGNWTQGVPIKGQNCQFERWNLGQGIFVLERFPSDGVKQDIEYEIFRLNPQTGHWKLDSRTSNWLTRQAHHKQKLVGKARCFRS